MHRPEGGGFHTRWGKHLNLPNPFKYLGLRLDSKLTWRHHIFTKRKQLGLALTLTKMYWLLGRRSRLSLSNKLLLYKPIWTYGIQLWGTASTSNIQILERFQSKTLRLLVDAPWYVPNKPHPSGPSNAFRQGRNLPLKSPLLHPPHHQVLALLAPPGTRRLRRHMPNDLPGRFIV
jgi:hypothetical protein